MAEAPERQRGRGRPRVDEPLERVSTRLPTKVYDTLVREAHRRDQSVASLVRQLLVVSIKP